MGEDVAAVPLDFVQCILESVTAALHPYGSPHEGTNRIAYIGYIDGKGGSGSGGISDWQDPQLASGVG